MHRFGGLAGFVRAWLLVLLVLLSVAVQAASARDQAKKRFVNPVLGVGQDPSVTTFHRRYYLVQSAADPSSITIRRSRSIKTLAASAQRVVWQGGESGSPCCQWWAPELHRIDGRWFIYAAADNGANVNHRLQVLESRSSSPLGSYVYRGQLTTPGNLWSIDPSPLALPGGGLYMFWSGWPGTQNGVQNIYIAAMSNPWTITGARTQLSTPQFSWERHPNPGHVYVNESPEPIVHGQTVSVTYSGSGCDTPDYALGLLYAPLGWDLLSPMSWIKSSEPILQSNRAAGIYGPGSNGWFRSPNGRQTWTVFHAVTDPHGNCGREREIYAQPVAWNANGTPSLGLEPQAANRSQEVPSGDPGASKAGART